MAKDYLDLVEAPDGKYFLVWYLLEEQEYGAYLGDLPKQRKKEPDRACDPDGWECWMADKIAREDPNVVEDGVLYWECKSHARSVLSKIKAAFLMKRPLADWEKKALEMGWKPPN